MFAYISHHIPTMSSLQINHHVPSSLNYTVDKLHVKFVLIRTVGNIHHAIRFAWQAEKRQAQFMSRGVGEKAAKNLRDSEQREARMVSTSCRWSMSLVTFVLHTLGELRQLKSKLKQLKSKQKLRLHIGRFILAAT